MEKLIFAAVLPAAAFFAHGQGVVDVHSHILPQTYIEYLAAHNALMDEGFPLPKWSAEAQLKWMDEAGVETAVLTLAAPHPLFGDKAENAAQVRKLNETAAREAMRQTPLAMQEYLSETTRAVCNMITRNVPARYSGIKIVVPHCGAYLPLAIPRMKALTPVMQKNGLAGEIDYEANLRQLYFDLAGAHSPEAIRLLLTITTPDHVMYGSDFPYVAPQVLTAGLEKMKKYLSEEPDLAPYRDMFLRENARALFNQQIKTNTKGNRQ